MQLQSSNPAIGAAERFTTGSWRDEVADVATLEGVANKTAFLVGLTGLAGVGAYMALPLSGPVLIGSCVAALIVGIGVAWSLARNPANAYVLAPVYGIVEGTFLGLFTKYLDTALLGVGTSAAAVGGSLALPALIITISCVVAMLTLYRVGLLRPTARFTAVLGTLTLGVMLAYLAMFVLSFFGVTVPFLSLSSATQGGQAAMIGMALNVGILILASLWLVVDFGAVEQMVGSGQPKAMEWYGGFALLVTLAWIYYEAVKLAFRLAIMFRGDD